MTVDALVAYKISHHELRSKVREFLQEFDQNPDAEFLYFPQRVTEISSEYPEFKQSVYLFFDLSNTKYKLLKEQINIIMKNKLLITKDKILFCKIDLVSWYSSKFFHEL